MKLLAFQIGSEVSINELAKNLGMSQETVNNYIDLLEKSFIVFRLSGFSKNLAKKSLSATKYYSGILVFEIALLTILHPSICAMMLALCGKTS
jgi:predicted AAA+ superfamily ATPase